MSFDQRIEQHDASVLSKSGKKGIGFAGSSRTVHNIDILNWKLDGLGIG